MTIFDRPDSTSTPLPEPYSSMLAFLSDLHEQVDLQVNIYGDETLRAVLIDLRTKIEAAGLLVIASTAA